MSLVRFCPSIVTVKQSFIVSLIVSSSVVLSLLVLLNSVNRDLTIRQRRRQWKSRWKIDFASFETFCPYTKSLESRKVGLELKRGDRVRIQRGRVKFIASPIPYSRQLKIWSFHAVVVPCVQGMWTEAIGLQFCEQKAVVHGVKRESFAQVHSDRSYSFPVINTVRPIFGHF